jgi:hypothetical protein
MENDLELSQLSLLVHVAMPRPPRGPGDGEDDDELPMGDPPDDDETDDPDDEDEGEEDDEPLQTRETPAVVGSRCRST